jgi:hypothetical protein
VKVTKSTSTLPIYATPTTTTTTGPTTPPTGHPMPKSPKSHTERVCGVWPVWGERDLRELAPNDATAMRRDNPLR